MSKRKPKELPLPPSHLIRIMELGLNTVSYRDEAVTCLLPPDLHGGATTRNEWLPRDILGEDGKTLILWREADRNYSTPGYEPWHDGMFGGRRSSIHSALEWVQRAKDIRAGKARDFLGV